MREILVGIRADQELKLNQMAKSRRSSRAALIREAIDKLLSTREKPEGDEAFGLWGNSGKDGLTYQREIRSEW